MRPREKRQIMIENETDAGKRARNAYLQSLPAEERSEAAAVYDHRIELAALDSSSDYYQERAKIDIFTQRRDLALLDHADTLGYEVHKLLFRLHRGHMTSAGQDRAVAEILDDLDMSVTQEQIDARAAELVQERRDYIRNRYGVE